MGFKGKIRNDKSGVSTLLIVAIVIVVVIVAAAAYLVLSGGGEEKESMAPGTTMKFDVTLDGEEFGIIEMAVIGQSAKEYFNVIKLGEEGLVLQYMVTSKATSYDMEITGTEVLETFEGTKTLTVMETVLDAPAGQQVFIMYTDMENGMIYKMEMIYTDASSGDSSIQEWTLLDYELVLQKSFKESKSIGMTYDYSLSVGAYTFSISLVCVADCLDDQYGILFDFSAFLGNGYNIYLLSDYVQGLPVDAVNTGGTYTLTGTIDGDVDVEIWGIAMGSDGLYFFYEPVTHIIYMISMVSEGEAINFDLVKKP